MTESTIIAFDQLKRANELRARVCGIEPDHQGVAEDGRAPQGDLGETEAAANND